MVVCYHLGCDNGASSRFLQSSVILEARKEDEVSIDVILHELSVLGAPYRERDRERMERLHDVIRKGFNKQRDALGEIREILDRLKSE